MIEFTKNIQNNESLSLSNENIKRLYKDSVEYNKRLIDNQNLTDDFYKSSLNLSDYEIDDNIYGYISIDNIDLTLPIFLGATEQNMSQGAVHLYNTSLPVDMKSTNVVIAGHTGFLGKTFFDDIPDLEIGDNVKITNYFGEINYTVNSKMEINSFVNNDMLIHNNKEELILVTCANYGKDRFVVICQK